MLHDTPSDGLYVIVKSKSEEPLFVLVDSVPPHVIVHGFFQQLQIPVVVHGQIHCGCGRYGMYVFTGA
jgi:hypothetical protein